MGLVRLPALRFYWTKGDLFGVELIKNCMVRDRFLMIMKFIHFSDNNSLDAKTNKLHKLEPLLNKFYVNCKSFLEPGSEFVIDETMVPWQGRLSFKQYIKNKSHKYGVKLFKLYTESGYTLNTKVYCGKESNKDSNNLCGHAEAVVMELMDDYLNKKRTLYADNFYNGIPLAENLLSHDTYLCGTLRKNRRGLPKEVLSQKLKKGDLVGLQNPQGVKIMKWKDKRDVLMISTKLNHECCLSESTKKARNGEVIKKPLCVFDYNRVKKGVDISD